MSTPRQAIVLAAGFGTRLDPLSRTLPKCLLPLWGRPLLDRTLDTLAAWGVRDVLVNLHHAPQPVWEHLCRRALTACAPRITCSYEPDILGTGGALQRAAWFLGKEPLWVVNGDIVFDVDPHLVTRTFHRRRAWAALLMTRRAGPRTVELAPDGEIRTFRSAHPGRPDTATFCGIQLLSREILRYVPDTGLTTLVTAYEAAQRDGRRVVGVDAGGAYWADVGTPEGLLAAHTDTRAATRQGTSGARLAPADADEKPAIWRRRGVTVGGAVSLGRDVAIGRGASLHGVVAMDGVRVDRGARVRDAVLGPGVRVAGTVSRLAVALASAADPELIDLVTRLGWPSGRTFVSPLSPRGSARSFRRLGCGTRRALVIRYSLERPENARFVPHARFLAARGVPVPRVLIDRPAQCLSVVEDVGTRDLAAAIAGRGQPVVLRTYRRVLQALVCWQRRAGPPACAGALALEPAFDARLYGWERDLFRTHYLTGRLGLADHDVAEAWCELERVSERLLLEPLTLVHRDLQSSNVLFRGAQPVFIDFQGMRLGPAVYDLASLLADPYVMLSPRVQDRLLADYARATGIRDAAALSDAFWHAAVQRLVQALGAYGRLSQLPGMSAFQRHICPALDMLDRAVGHLYSLAGLRKLVHRLKQAEATRIP